MSTAALAAPAPSKVLNVVLWIFQVLLGAMFVMAGSMKATKPIADLVAANIIWAADIPEALVRFIGVSELLGGLGLLLPSLTRIKPVLTVFAALGLALVMVLAAGFHVTRNEFGGVPINLTMGAIAAFIAWGRWKKAPITPR